MAVLFMGGSIIDYSSVVNRVDVNTVNNFRSGFAKSALYTPGGGAPLSNFLVGDFNATSSNFWFSYRASYQWSSSALDEAAKNAADRPFLVFLNGNTKLFGLFLIAGAVVMKRYTNDAVSTTGYDAQFLPGWRVVDFYKMDLNVVLNGANSRLRIFQNNELVMDYTGTLSSAASVNRFYLASSDANASYGVHWSEVFAMERDTRTMALKTHNPLALRPDNAWAGNASDIATEDYRNTATVMSTPTPELMASLTTDALPTGSYRVRAVKVSAIAARGETGPTGLQLGVAALPASSSRERVGAHRYWRMAILKTRGGALPTTSSYGVTLSRLKFYETLYEATLPVGEIIGTGASLPGAFSATRGDFWYSKDATLDWIGVRYADPVTVSAIGYTTAPYSGSYSAVLHNPTQFRIDYSDDGVTWTPAWEVAEYADTADTEKVYPLFTDPALERQPVLGPVEQPDLTFTKLGTIFETNPLTAQPWKGEDVNAMGLYLKSRA